MRKTDFSSITRLSVIFVLIAAMALSVISCGTNNNGTETPMTTDGTTGVSTDVGTDVTSTDSDDSTEVEAKYTITVTVVDDKGVSTDFEIKTDAGNLGEALLEAKLVEGEMGDYGLYIKTVNGLRADYDLDGAYWALSKNGEYLMTGADKTSIADGEHYELTYTK